MSPNTARAGHAFLNALKAPLVQKAVNKKAYIISHSDSDGIAAALVGNILLGACGYKVDIDEIIFLNHPEMPAALNSIDLENHVVLFTDIIPKAGLPKNGFCIDHHAFGKGSHFSEKHFIYLPESKKDFPSCAALVAEYLLYLNITARTNLQFDEFCAQGMWAKTEDWLGGDAAKIVRRMVFLGLTCDNIWLFSKLYKGEPGASALQASVKEHDEDVEELRHTSISVSLEVGAPRNPPARVGAVKKFIENPMDPWVLKETRNMIEFADSMNLREFKEEERKKAVNNVMKYTADLMEDNIRLNAMKFNKTMRHLTYWQDRVAQMEEECRALVSDTAKVCVFLEAQKYSNQVKGILSSLLYFNGYSNLVLEVDKPWDIVLSGKPFKMGAWGARGIKKSELQKVMTVPATTEETALKSAAMLRVSDILTKEGIPLIGNDIKLEFDDKVIWYAGGRHPVYGGNIPPSRVVDINKVQKDYQNVKEGAVPTLSNMFIIFQNLMRGGWIPIHVSGEIADGNGKFFEAGEAYFEA